MNDPTPTAGERLAHLEALADLVHAFIERAGSIDAHYDPDYAAMAHELRALGYQVRSDVGDLPQAETDERQPR